MIMHDPSVMKSLYGSRNAHKRQRGGSAESAKRSIESAEKFEKNNHRTPPVDVVIARSDDVYL